MSSTVGSLTRTGWNRRSSAASFSMFLRYSSMVVAPTTVQLAASESGFEHVGGVHRALGSPGPHHRVQLVDEEDQLIRVLPHLVYDLLEALLELSAVLGACHDAGEVEGEDPLAAKGLWHLAR